MTNLSLTLALVRKAVIHLHRTIGVKARIGALPLFGLAIGLAMAVAPDARGSYDAFLRFRDPVSGAPPAGESLDKTYNTSGGWFALDSFDGGILNEISIGTTSGSGAGKAQLQDFHFRKAVNAASPSLFEAVGAGGHYGSAELVLRQPFTGGTAPAPQPFYSIILRNAYIKSLNWNASSGDEAVAEDVDVLYTALQWSYTRFDATGKPLTTLTVNWDQISNTGGDGALPGNAIPTLSYPSAVTVQSGGSLDVSPSAGPSDSDGIASVSLVSAGGYTGGISVDGSGIVHFSSAAPVGGPYTISIQAADTLGATKTATFALTVSQANPPLIANADTVNRALGGAVQITTDSLIANDSSGAIFDGLVATNSTLGGQVSISGGAIAYQSPTPDPGGDDTFQYRIRDVFNQTQTGLVTIHVGNPTGGPSGNLTIGVSQAGTSLALAGTAGHVYQLQRASSVSGPWSNLGNAVTADGNGAATWLDTDTTSPRFYRAFQGQ